MKQKKVMWKGKDMETVTDFDTLKEFKDEWEKKLGNKYFLFIAPKMNEQRKNFIKSFVRANKPFDELKNNSLLMKSFPKYQNMKLEILIYNGEELDGAALFIPSLIDTLKGESPTVSLK